MTNTISIKLLEDSTTEQVQDLNKLMQQLNPHIPAVSLDTLQDLLSDKNMRIFVALNSENKIIGTLTLHIYYTFSGKRGSIEDVVVDEAFRGHGLGQKLVLTGLQAARDLGLQYVDLTSRPSRVAANQLYQKLGFKKRETNVYRFVL